MKSFDDYIEIALRLCFRSATGKSGYFAIVSGAYLISPSLFTDVLNLVLSQATFGLLPAPAPMPTAGVGIFLVGVLLVLVSHFWAPRHKHKEVIGIRHNSLGAFAKEAICKDLPVLQRLETYREIDVDHSDSYTNGKLSDHQSVIRRLDRVPDELRGLLGSAPDSPIAYYGLPHVPLAFYLGYLLSDSKYRVDLYELNNESGRWDQLSGITRSINITSTANEITSSEARGDVVIAVGISYPVHQSEIAELVIPGILATVEINARNPQRQLITNHDQIMRICDEFRKTLEAIKKKFPACERIHLFYAGPVSISFALGRCISERIDPEIVVYNYSSKSTPRYAWSLSLNGPHQASARFNIHQKTGGSDAPVQHA